jgi:hypothetical protein
LAAYGWELLKHIPGCKQLNLLHILLRCKKNDPIVFFELETEMELDIESAQSWSEFVFSQCDFKDKRLTKRLIQIGNQLSLHTGSSLLSSCEGDESKIEGSYRLLRNKRVTAKAIGSGGYKASATLAKDASLILAIEDSTSLSYSHEVRKELGLTGRYKNAYQRGYMVHSTLLVDAEKERTLGLVAQERWCREESSYGKSRERKKTSYEDKESIKWEQNTIHLEHLLEEHLSSVISVCDREADIYEYLHYKHTQGQRFLVRAKHNRLLKINNSYLFDELKQAKALGNYTINIAQKGGRKERQALIELKSVQVTLTPPRRQVESLVTLTPIMLTGLLAQEIKTDSEEPLQWILLTSEPITHFEEARKIARYYELRWKIEDFHKAWKSGVGAEDQRMQSAENLEKMVVILSFVAVRLLQLKEHFEQRGQIIPSEQEQVPCNTILSEIEWKILWKAIEKKEFPKMIPSAAWAYKAIAKLGGWSDSKRNGKAAWATVWKGFFRLRERVEGYLVAVS